MRSPLVAVVFVAALPWMSAQVPAQSNAPISVSFNAPSAVVLGEPVIFQVALRNNLPEPVELDLGEDRKGNLRIRITGPDEVTINAPRFVATDVHRVGKLSIAPSATHLEEYVLDEWTPLRRVGRYRVVFAIDTAPRTKSGKPLTAPPDQSVEITVTSPDDARLLQACDRIANRGTTSELAQVRLDTGRALRQFRDPAALPCLTRVIHTTTRFDSFIVPTLTDMGTDSARALLEEMFRSNDQERYKLASHALLRFRSRNP